MHMCIYKGLMKQNVIKLNLFNFKEKSSPWRKKGNLVQSCTYINYEDEQIHKRSSFDSLIPAITCVCNFFFLKSFKLGGQPINTCIYSKTKYLLGHLKIFFLFFLPHIIVFNLKLEIGRMGNHFFFHKVEQKT